MSSTSSVKPTARAASSQRWRFIDADPGSALGERSSVIDERVAQTGRSNSNASGGSIDMRGVSERSVVLLVLLPILFIGAVALVSHWDASEARRASTEARMAAEAANTMATLAERNAAVARSHADNLAVKVDMLRNGALPRDAEPEEK